MSTDVKPSEIVVLDKKLENEIARLDTEANKYFLATQNDTLGVMYRAVVLAKGIKELRQVIEPLMPHFMALQGSELGFRTDQDEKGGYAKEVVRDCLVTGFLSGVWPIGNQLNIIAKRTYITKEGYAKKVREIPGLTNLEGPICGIPAVKDGHTCVRVLVKWKLNGVPGQLLGTDGNPGRVFPVRVNQGMIVDAILGKAQRKALKATYEQICGTDFLPDGEVDTDVQPGSAPLPEGSFSLRSNGSNKAAAPMPVQEPEPAIASRDQIRKIDGLIVKANITAETMNALCASVGAKSITTATADQAERLIIQLEEMASAAVPANVGGDEF